MAGLEEETATFTKRMYLKKPEVAQVHTVRKEIKVHGIVRILCFFYIPITDFVLAIKSIE